MKRWSNIAAETSVVILFLLHLPFLNADPDYFLSIGRDAFTDEGLNTSQLRNYINHGHLDLNECDNMIKSPLFNALLYVPFKVFGTKLIVARLTILLTLLAALSFLLRNEYFEKIIPPLLITTLTQFYVFQYSHFSLSEIMAVTFILLGIFFLFKSITRTHEHPGQQATDGIFPAALFFSAAYFLKIQFAYVILLLPASVIILEMKKNSSLPEVLKSRTLWKGSLLLISFAALYLIAWYLPFRSTFDFVMKDETGGKFASVINIPKTIGFNIIHILFSEQNRWFNSLVVVSFALGIFLVRKTEDKNFRALFAVSSLWMIIECHKLAMVYLPSRYLVSYYFAAGLMSCTVLLHLLSRKKMFLATGIAMALIFTAANSISYYNLFERRTYHIEAINNYFSATLKNHQQPVMGPWAPTATWNCKARCIPVWKDFMNDKDVINRFHPQVILSEPNEDESNHAYSSQGIQLASLADSTHTFQLGHWTVVAYWMK